MAKEKKIYVLPDSEFRMNTACPTCGGRMTPGEYYIAVQGDTTVKVDNSEAGLGKVTKTITTQYRDIRKKTGGLCPKCFTDEYERFKKEWLIAGIAYAAFALACVVFIILCFAVPAINEAVAPQLKFLGIVVAVVAAFFAFKSLTTSKQIGDAIHEINRGARYTVSTYLVSLLKQNGKSECAANEAILTALQAKQLNVH